MTNWRKIDGLVFHLNMPLYQNHKGFPGVTFWKKDVRGNAEIYSLRARYLLFRLGGVLS